MFLSVSFIQMLKALMPVAVFCMGCLFKVETFSIKTFVNMVSDTQASINILPFGLSHELFTYLSPGIAQTLQL